MARLHFARCLLLTLVFIGPLARGADHTVFIFDYYFTPTNLTVMPGDTVTWINRGANPHDTTEINGNWASPLLSNDEEFFSYTFNQAGRFPYICLVHIADFPQQTGLVVVASANLPPSVRIAAPAAGSIFTAPAAFTITAEANDPDGSVVNVQFFLNGTPAGSSSGPAFTANVNGLAANTYTITAIATDDLGATAVSDPVVVTVQEDAPARFPLSVSVLPAGSGSVALDPPQPVEGYNAGTVVTVTASAAAGFAFNGWSGDATGTENPITIAMSAARSITANFSSNVTSTFVLMLATNPPGAGSIVVAPAPNGPNGTYLQGTVVTLTAVPAPDFAFTNWTGDLNSTSNSVAIAMNADHTVTANFFASITPRFALTVLTNPPGSGTVLVSPPPGANGTYVAGTIVTLTATALGTNLFTNWIGSVNSSSNRVTLLMDADKTVTATFVPIVPVRYALTTAIAPEGAGTVLVTPASTNGSYAAGTVVALAAQPAPGFSFVRWTGAHNSTNNPIVITMTGDRSVTAEFAAIAAVDFSALRGGYTGLLIDDNDTNYTTSGLLNIRLSKTGAYRGNATIGGLRQAVRGQFDRFGYAPLVLRNGTLSGSLQLDVAGVRITGVLTDSSNPNPTTRRSPALLLYRVGARTNGAALAGSYDLSIEPHTPVGGAGTAAMQILPNGIVRLRGILGDGTSWTERTFLSVDGTVPLFTPLYRQRGLILGWIDVADSASIGGTVRWFRPADSRSVTYPDGFALRLSVAGSRIE